MLLAGVHALRPSDIRVLMLDDTDPAAGTLFLAGRARPLDQLTVEQLRAWLQARRARWPATANPHLLINRSAAGGLEPVSRGYIQARAAGLGITAQYLRADRLIGPSPGQRRRPAPAHPPVRDQRPHRHPLLRRAGQHRTAQAPGRAEPGAMRPGLGRDQAYGRQLANPEQRPDWTA